MMGKKKLSAIRADLRRAFAKRGGDAGKAIERLIREARAEPVPDEREIDALRTIRDALARHARKRRGLTART
ncbi:MAG: hypothetical protein HY721_29300 [Planctomycetes bacterium]|nr:hypothetical protein [Planctomycetota bacterium]